MVANCTDSVNTDGNREKERIEVVENGPNDADAGDWNQVRPCQESAGGMKRRLRFSRSDDDVRITHCAIENGSS